jgi:hypothetical protein
MPATIWAPSGTKASSLLFCGEVDPRTATEVITNARKTTYLDRGKHKSSLSAGRVADPVCDMFQMRTPVFPKLIRLRALCGI